MRGQKSTPDMLRTHGAVFDPIQPGVKAAAVAAVLFLNACASTPLPTAFESTAFTSGELQLDCLSVRCANQWRIHSAEIQELYDAEDWEALATLVGNLQFGSDLAYFYLGRAAEGLEAYAGASRYYERAVSGAKICGEGFFNNCGGVDVPARVRERSELLADLLLPPTMDLVEAQTRLRQLGLYTIEVDGISGPRTLAAIRQFQDSQGIEVSGELDTATIRALAKTATTAGVVSSEAIEDSADAVADKRATQLAVAELASPIEKVAVAGVDEVSSDIAVAEAAPANPIDAADESVVEASSVEITAADTAPLNTASVNPTGAEANVEPLPTVADGSAKPDVLFEATAETSHGSVDEHPEAAGNVEFVAMTEQPASEPAQIDAERTQVKVAVELLSDADPFANVVAVLEQGAWVTVINWGDEWSIVSHERSTGYVYTDILQ